MCEGNLKLSSQYKYSTKEFNYDKFACRAPRKRYVVCQRFIITLFNIVVYLYVTRYSVNISPVLSQSSALHPKHDQSCRMLRKLQTQDLRI